MVIPQFVAFVSLWIRAVRAPFFTASIIPVAVGGCLAFWQKVPLAWPLFPLMLLSTMCLHAGTNCINDYYDFKNGVDKKSTMGSSRVLVDEILTPHQVWAGSMILFATGVVLGIVLIICRGLPLMTMGVIGLAGGYLYSGKPLGLKYIALGDVMVFILMGPLLVFSSYYALTSIYSLAALWVSLPVGFLVTAILHANNTRDICFDKSAGIRTLAMLLGFRGAKVEYYFLLSAAYLSVLAMIVAGKLPLLSGIVFLSLPLAIGNMTVFKDAPEDDPEAIAFMDVRTAQLHLVFGVLYIISFVVAGALAWAH